MDSERNRLQSGRTSVCATRGACVARAMSGLAAVTILAASGCRYDEPTPPPANTGPGTTIARIVVESGPGIITVGDSAFYTATAYDNANNALPVTLTWASTDSRVLDLDSFTGRGKGVGAGDVQVYAYAGSASSNRRSTRVQPAPAFP